MFDPQHLHSIYRKLWLYRIPVLPKLLCCLNTLLTGCYLPASVRVGHDVRFEHWGLGVSVHPYTIIGDGTLLLPHARVMADKEGRGAARIIIGCRVQLSVGSVVLASGVLEIGDDAQIGAGALVRTSVPAGATAMGCEDPQLRRRYLPSSKSRYDPDSRPLIDPVAIHSLAQWLYRRGIQFLPGLLYRLNYLVNRCIISPTSEIGKRVQIGRWVTLNSQSTIGDESILRPGAMTARKVKARRAQPLDNIAVGKRVEIGAAAIVVGLGLMEVGDDARIEEGAVVTRSVPPACTVAGIPARIVGGPGGSQGEA